MKQHHVIYVPGIKDDLYRIQSSAIKLWRLHGVRGHCHEMPWYGEEAWEPKFQRLLEEIDSYIKRGHRVSLAGASAGASAVLNAYVERRDDISGLIYICAKINAPETISDATYAANPAFKTSMKVLQDNLGKLTPADKVKMRSYYSPGDGFVPHAATAIKGVDEFRLPALRHGRAIFYCLTFGASQLMRFLK